VQQRNALKLHPSMERYVQLLFPLINRRTHILAFLNRPRNNFSACHQKLSLCYSVIIITNSDEGWVKFSAERFVPYLIPVIAKYRIISARTRYERFYPNQPLCWKAAAFAHEVNEIYEDSTGVDVSRKVEIDLANDSVESMESTDVSSETSSLSEGALRREIISFGDSMEERTAVKIVSGQLSAIAKSVMFISGPSPLQIIGQLNMVTSHMKFVCEHDASLDLEISPSQAQRCAETYLERNKILADHFEQPKISRRNKGSIPKDPHSVMVMGEHHRHE